MCIVKLYEPGIYVHNVTFDGTRSDCYGFGLPFTSNILIHRLRVKNCSILIFIHWQAALRFRKYCFRVKFFAILNLIFFISTKHQQRK